MFSTVIEPRHHVNNLPGGGISQHSPNRTASPTITTPIKQSEKGGGHGGHHHGGGHHHHLHRDGGGGHGHGHHGPSGSSRLSSTAPTTTGFHSSLLKALQEDSDEDEDDYLDWTNGEYTGQMELVTSPSHAASQKGGGGPGGGGGDHAVHGEGGIGGKSGTAHKIDSPVSPTSVNAAAPTNDIRVMLASGNSTPVEVLRNQVVTSLTLKLKPDWMSKHSMGGMGALMEGMGVTRKLLLAGSDTGGGTALPGIDELETLSETDPSEYRNLMMRLCDLQYICIKAAVDVSDMGEIEEREYWLPLDKTQTVADLKKLITGADQLEAEGPKLLDSTAGESVTDLSMVLAGRPLEDTHTVLEEGLTHNTVVHLFVKKDANITVKMRGTKDLEVKLNADETAESLRAKLEALRPKGSPGLKPSNSQLFYGGQELKDGPLNMYGITDGATLELKPYTSPKGVTIPGKTHTRHSWNSSAAWKPAGVSSNSWVSTTGSLGMNSAAMSGSVGNTSSSDTSSASTTPPGGDLDLYGRDINNGHHMNMHHHQHHHQMNNVVNSHHHGHHGGSGSPPVNTQYGSPDLARSFDLARQGLAAGNRPQLASGGTGGAYFLRGSDGETCAVFKPADEEPCARNNPRGRNVSGPGGEGLRKGTRVGEGASREVAAYVLDHANFAGVPATSLANLCEMRRSPSGKDLGGKLGSLQAYVRADAEAEEMGPALFPVHEVHKITQLDVRLANTDRNAGNILVQKGDEGLKLVPIDHGYALPHTLEDVCFEWEFWPQAKLPYSEETREYIAAIDVEADVQLIREQGIELQPSSERVLRVCTTLLQKAAAIGCCPADIAGMMSRPMPNRMSDLEKLTSRAASQASSAVRAQDGLVVHLAASSLGSNNNNGGGGGKGEGGGGSGGAWDDLDNNDRMEARFMVEYEKLLDSYLEGFEPELELEH